MATQKTKFSVGLFITCGIIIAVLAVMWLGISRVFEKGRLYATYFDESVQGLGLDSPVKYRGVPVGRVAEISVAPDSKLIEVVLKVESGQEMGHDIVAQLKMVGITGSVFVELDRIKKGEPDRSPVLNFPSKYPIIASKPGEISQLLAGVDDVLKQIRNLDLAGISDRIKQTLDSVNVMIADANVGQLSAKLGKSLENLNNILDTNRWDRIMVSIEEAGQSLNQVMNKTNANLDQLEGTLGKVDGIVSDNRQAIQLAINDFRSALGKVNRFFDNGAVLFDNTDESVSQVRENLLVVTRDLSRTSHNLNRLIESLAQNPSLFLFGKQPAPRELEE